MLEIPYNLTKYRIDELLKVAILEVTNELTKVGNPNHIGSGFGENEMGSG